MSSASPPMCRGIVPTRLPTSAGQGADDAALADEICCGARTFQPSPLSRFFAALRSAPSPEVRADAALADVADAAMRSLHQASQRHKPFVQHLQEGMSHEDRLEQLVWLLRAFDVMHFTDGLLFDTALLLDRYYASLPRDDARTGMSRKLLAAVCMAMKTGTGSTPDVQLPLRQVVRHLGRDEVAFDDVLSAELAILQKLRFQVGTPSARDFLETLCTRLSSSDRVSTACRNLAEFLLQLTLCDVQIHYRHPHAVLAAAAMILALHTLRGPSSAYATLVEDLALHCPEHGTLLACATSLHGMWVRSMNSPQDPNSYVRHLCLKFGRAPHHVSSIAPPSAPPHALPLPAALATQYGDVDQDDLEGLAAGIQAMTLENTPSVGAAGEAARHVWCPYCGRAALAGSSDPHAGACVECGIGSENIPAEGNKQKDRHWGATSGGVAATRQHTLASDAPWKAWPRGARGDGHSGMNPSLVDADASGRSASRSSCATQARSVLTRHDWTSDRYARQQETQLLEMARAARARGTEKARANVNSLSAAVASSARPLQQRRPRRATSWCGQRTVARTLCASTRSP